MAKNKSSNPIIARVVHKFNVRNSSDKQAIILHLISGEDAFDFALTRDAAKNLCAALDKAAILLQELGSSSTH